MEAPKEDVTTHIVKGKRTKRQRVQSPIPFSLGTNSLPEEEGGGDHIANINADQDGAMINSNSWPSPTSTANANHFQDATETDYINHQGNEDEDMANCLILLAQGGHSRGIPKLNDHQYSFQDTRPQSNVKFNSRRFLETGSTGSGKAGYYVYECKTCGKTFPSFQALGGHRASHKKPKGLFNDEKKRPATPALSSDDEDAHYKNISSLSLQLSNNNFRNYRGAYNNHSFINTKVKMHECAICGTEFTSGQALGGHMRRHRAVPVGVDDANSNLSLAPITSLIMEPTEFDESNGGRNELSLDLDLNLPAPEEQASSHSKILNAPQHEPQTQKEEEQEKKQHQEQQHQQKHPEQHQQQLPIVISSPTLVDCHY